MIRFSHTLSKKLTGRPNNIFLLDGFGALLTAFMLSVVLAGFEHFFGMPRNVLYMLAAIAGVFAVYSLCCYRFVSRNHRPFLLGIIIANLSYCILSIAMALCYFQQLKTPGLVYFILEIVVILALVFIELTCWRQLRNGSK